MFKYLSCSCHKITYSSYSPLSYVLFLTKSSFINILCIKSSRFWKYNCFEKSHLIRRMNMIYIFFHICLLSYLYFVFKIILIFLGGRYNHFAVYVLCRQINLQTLVRVVFVIYLTIFYLFIKLLLTITIVISFVVFLCERRRKLIN